tara:strand:+ start:1646 stop:1771 length:126 start_codon:yes stop_codon:yes gene_type:complete
MLARMSELEKHEDVAERAGDLTDLARFRRSVKAKRPVAMGE